MLETAALLGRDLPRCDLLPGDRLLIGATFAITFYFGFASDLVQLGTETKTIYLPLMLHTSEGSEGAVPKEA